MDKSSFIIFYETSTVYSGDIKLWTFFLRGPGTLTEPPFGYTINFGFKVKMYV